MYLYATFSFGLGLLAVTGVFGPADRFSILDTIISEHSGEKSR